MRFVRDTLPRTFDAGDGLGPQLYTPLAFDWTSSTTTTDGSLPSSMLRVSNVRRILQGAITQYQGAVGSTVSLYVVNTASPGGECDLAVQYTILKSQPSNLWITFTLSAASPIRQLFPKWIYNQGGPCLWLSEYKGPRCGYAGNLPTCDGSFDGANGCIAHGNNRILAFPSISSNGGSEATAL